MCSCLLVFLSAALWPLPVLDVWYQPLSFVFSHVAIGHCIAGNVGRHNGANTLPSPITKTMLFSAELCIHGMIVIKYRGT